MEEMRVELRAEALEEEELAMAEAEATAKEEVLEEAMLTVGLAAAVASATTTTTTTTKSAKTTIAIKKEIETPVRGKEMEKICQKTPLKRGRKVGRGQGSDLSPVARLSQSPPPRSSLYGL